MNFSGSPIAISPGNARRGFCRAPVYAYQFFIDVVALEGYAQQEARFAVETSSIAPTDAGKSADEVMSLPVVRIARNRNLGGPHILFFEI